MSYRETIIRRWSHRDRLAIVMVALTVAFLTGSTLFIVAASAQPLALADPLTSSGTADALEPGDAPEDALVLPVAEVTKDDGTNATVIGVPANAAESWDVPPPPDDGFGHGEETAGSVEFEGDSGAVEAAVYHHGEDSLLDPNWYITDPETVADLGTTETLVITDDETHVPASGVPLQSVLGFFVAGQSQLLTTLGAVVAGGAILVAVTVYSVTRMSVRDRLATIRTVRSTGAAPRTILGTFALRASLLTAIGVTLGYALGVILPNAALSAAVFLGLPTALDLRLTSQALYVLGPTYVGLVLLSAVAGMLASWSAVRSPPAQLSTTVEGPRSPGLLLLDWRTLVPTTATLSVFLSILFVTSTLAMTAAPVVMADSTTISEPGVAHPVNSELPAEYANTLHADDIDASAEIIGFAVVDNQPFLTRGVEYDDFEAVTDADLEDGRAHEAPDEAVIGVSLAQTLDIDVGESLTVGGSTADGVSRVTVVGTYTAPGAHEDQLLLSLRTAQHLSGLDTDKVYVIRTAELPDTGESDSGVTVLDVSASEGAIAHDSFEVEVTLRNHDSDEQSYPLTAGLGDEETEQEVRLEGEEQRTVQLSLPTGEPGEELLQVDETAIHSVGVVHPETPELHGVPDKMPPGSQPLIEVRTETGEPLADTPVTVANETAETDSEGHARLPAASEGSHEIRVETEHGIATETIEISDDAEREPVTSISVSPDSLTVLTTPEAEVSVYNPWNEPLDTTVRIIGPDTTSEEQVTLDAGEYTEFGTILTRQPPGSYDVHVETDDTVGAETSYEVSGDERIGAAAASVGQTEGSSDLGQAIEAAVGNLTLLLGGLGSLVAVMTIGGLSAAIARAVHARRRTIGIHRATGASPRRILQLVLRDTVIIGTVGASLAFVASLLVMQLLDVTGLLTVYGIRIPAIPPPGVLLVGFVVSIALTLCSATVALISLLYEPPASVMTREQRAMPGGESRER